ncbi:MAG TPA: choice-of-anchor tandem repeat GloVer-containing protein [Phycisphaerae bacterium]|nr:choice-of-anchor tandem repeat GloVer-containing protein [Phycisphaerae bacterium]
MHTRRILPLIAVALSLTAALPARADYTLLTSLDPAASKGVIESQAHPVLLDGSLYFTGVTGGPHGGGTVARYDIASNTLSIVYGLPDSGLNAYGGVALGPDGMLYGTTWSGNNVYRVAPDGSDYQLLHTFDFGNNFTGPVAFSGNTLYVTSADLTSHGGIYSMNLDGSNFQTLYSYNGGGPRFAGLTISGSTIYGVRTGDIFTLNIDGAGYTSLFPLSPRPYSGFETTPILSGNTLYGMASSGGANGGGALYSVNTDGSALTDLHDFDTGASPADSLYLVGNTLYGMTQMGGANADGYIFSINTDGADFQILHTFTGGATDGYWPRGSFTFDPSTNTLYGMTLRGGANDTGIIFALSVPEPASLALLVLATPFLLRRRRLPA